MHEGSILLVTFGIMHWSVSDVIMKRYFSWLVSLVVSKSYECKLDVIQMRLITETLTLKFKQLLIQTRLAKRGLPHTSNSMKLEDHNLVIKKHINLKFTPYAKLRMLVLTTD